MTERGYYLKDGNNLFFFIMPKKIIILMIFAFFLLFGAAFAPAEEAAPDAVKPVSGESWIVPTTAEKSGYDFTGYSEDKAIVVIADNKPLKTPSPVLKKGDDIWLPLALVAPALNIMLLKIDSEKYTVIRSDGLNLELKVGEKEVVLNRFLLPMKKVI